MNAKVLLSILLFTVPAIAISAELGKLAEAVDQEKAAESVDVD